MDEAMIRHLETMNVQEKELTALYRQAMIRFRISHSEFWVLYALMLSEKNYSQQDICEIWFLPKQTVNSVIKSLVKKGLVVLEMIPKARNRKTIYLTDVGKEFGTRTVIPIRKAELRALARMNMQEQSAHISLNQKYTDCLREELNEL